MIAFVHNFAGLLADETDIPVFSDFSGVQDAQEYIVATLESSSELYPASRTMQLEISVEWVQTVEELTENTPADYSAIAPNLENLLQSVFARLEKYRPLPGQHASSPVLLNWYNTPPELVAENYKYSAESKVTIFAQF